MITPAKLIRKMRGRKPAFTLVEVVIASSIFTIVSLIGVTVFVNVTRIQRRISLENAIYEDGRFMMERLAREIRKNTIDYEEYYNRLVESTTDFGQEHGCYASRFYSPGTAGNAGANGPEAGGLGVWCSDNKDPHGTPKSNPDCTINKTTLDINTGQNPFDGIAGNNSAATDAAAVCDSKFGQGAKCNTPNTNYNDQPQLYLIDYKGSQKTIFALKTLPTSGPNGSEHALSLVKINGEDKDNDGINETWENLPDGFDSNYGNNNETLNSTLTVPSTNTSLLYKGFIPISPLRTNITDLHFYVSPLEDPRKAVSPNEPADVRQQPHVTVVMTLEPAASELTNFAGNKPTITIQQTISSRVYNEVKSYHGAACTNGKY